MEEVNRLKNKLEKLKQHKIDPAEINKNIEYAGIERKRELKIREISNSYNSMKITSKKQIETDFMNKNEYFYVSQKIQLVRNGSPIEKIVPTVAISRNVLKDFLAPEARKSILKDPFRTTIPVEFEIRLNILISQIIQGSLDDILDLDAKVIIHQIMGMTGELLPRLKIDPAKGTTVITLTNFLILNARAAKSNPKLRAKLPNQCI